MTDQLQYRIGDAGYLSSLYELIGFGGAIAAGYLSDRAARGQRLPVACIMQVALAGMCFVYAAMAAAGPAVIEDALGGLSPESRHAGVLSIDALRALLRSLS